MSASCMQPRTTGVCCQYALTLPRAAAGAAAAILRDGYFYCVPDEADLAGGTKKNSALA